MPTIAAQRMKYMPKLVEQRLDFSEPEEPTLVAEIAEDGAHRRPRSIKGVGQRGA